MMEFLKKLFKTTKPRNAGRRVFRPILESLEAREVPSGGPWFGGGHDLALFNRAQVGPAAAGQTGGSNNQGDGFLAGLGVPTLAATLTGSNGASGIATFAANSATGNTTLNVHASGLTADTTYTVSSGTTTLGTFTTNATGQGKLHVSSVSPALTAGSVITITDPSGKTALSGTLAATNLFATLGGTSGRDGFASYHTNVFTGSSTLRVGLFGLSANSTYTVQLDGTTVGTVTTNALGAGHLSTSSLSKPPAAGSVLTVLNASGTTVLQGTLTAPSFGFFGGWFPH
jgi:hypothetical protein